MPRIILIKGPSGSGKSTLFKLLAAQLLGVTAIDLGEIKDSIRDVPNRLEKKKLAHFIYYPQVRDALEASKDLLLQESSKRDLREEFGDLLSNKGYEIISFMLCCPLEECLIRNRKRAKTLDFEYVRGSYPYLSTAEDNDLALNSFAKSPQELLAEVLQVVYPNE